MLLVLTGQPCSGKSTVARRLAELAAEAGVEARVVAGEEEDGTGGAARGARDSAYADSAAERQTRARFKGAVERGLSARRLTVADAPNAIKGYRYELWCAARAAGGRAAVVHVDVGAGGAARAAGAAGTAAAAGENGGGGGGGLAVARRWNEARLARGEDGYSPAVFDDLSGRYERPDSRNRWDAPLFTVRWGGGGAARSPEQGAAAAAAAAAAAGQGAGGIDGGHDAGGSGGDAGAAVRAPEVDAVLRAALFAVTGGKAGGSAAAAASGRAGDKAEAGAEAAAAAAAAAAKRRAGALAEAGLASGLGRAGGGGGGGGGGQLSAGVSTARPALAETNTLYAIDRECQVRRMRRRSWFFALRGRGARLLSRAPSLVLDRALFFAAAAAHALTRLPPLCPPTSLPPPSPPPDLTQEVVNLILEAQAAACGGAGPGFVELSSASSSGGGVGGAAPLRLRLPAGGAGGGGGVPVAELRAHKRAFVKMATRREHGRVEDPATARRLFVEYLSRQLAA